MSESKHTPGPWSVVASTPSLIEDLSGTAFIQVTDRVPGLSTFDLRLEETWANARLIAAAPEMLIELKRMVHAYVSLLESGRDRITALGGDCDPVDVMEAGNPQLIAAKAAIAKAEGRS